MRFFKFSQDDYMEAVAIGDMDKAARLVHEAAEASGYGIGPVFHGGEFDVKHNRSFVVGDEGFVFFSPLETAQWYADQNGKSRVTAAYLREDEYLEISAREWLMNQLDDGTLLDDVKDAYAGFRINSQGEADDPAFGPGPIYAVSVPESIKSAEPVTRDDQGHVIPLDQRFNSSNPDIRY